MNKDHTKLILPIVSVLALASMVIIGLNSGITGASSIRASQMQRADIAQDLPAQMTSSCSYDPEMIQRDISDLQDTIADLKNSIQTTNSALSKHDKAMTANQNNYLLCTLLYHILQRDGVSQNGISQFMAGANCKYSTI